MNRSTARASLISAPISNAGSIRLRPWVYEGWSWIRDATAFSYGGEPNGPLCYTKEVMGADPMTGTSAGVH